MKENKKGFGHLLLFVIVVLLVVGVAGWYVISNQKTISSPSNKAADTNSVIKIESAKLTFTYPKSWKLAANNQNENNGYVELDSPDNFQLGFTASTAAGLGINDSNGASSDLAAKAVYPINSLVGSLIIYSDGAGKYGSVAVSRDSIKVGDKLIAGNTLKDVLNNPERKNVFVAIHGGYTNTFDSLSGFNSASGNTMSDLKKILASISFYK
jgi:hypothetical protein